MLAALLHLGNIEFTGASLSCRNGRQTATPNAPPDGAEIRMALAATFPDAPPLQDKEFVRRRSHGARSLAPWLPSRARRPAT